MRFSKEVTLVIELSEKKAKEFSHPIVTIDHFIYAFCCNNVGKEILSMLNVDVKKFKSKIINYLDQNLHNLQSFDNEKLIIFSSELQVCIEKSMEHMRSSQKKMIKLGDILFQIYSNDNSFSSNYLRENVKKIEFLRIIAHANLEKDSVELHDKAVLSVGQKSENWEDFFLELIDSNIEVSSSKNRLEKKRKIEKKKEKEKNIKYKEKEIKKQGKIIANFTTCLNDKVLHAGWNPLIGRERELDRLVQILCRRIKNNPILIGDPGVGKTAIVEGLAHKIVNKEVPLVMWSNKIYSLDLVSILAGTQYRGDLEAKMQTVITALKKQEPFILFIDEIHNIVGMGSVGQNSFDLSNYFKPLLNNGEITCIGATTFDEYKKYFEKDAALTRRFQPIAIDEPNIKDTISIINGIKSKYEDFHGIKYTNKSIETAVNLSKRYILDRFLPDKAIDVIDEAGAFLKIKKNLGVVPSEITDYYKENSKLKKNQQNIDTRKLTKPEIREFQILSVIAKMCKIPLDQLTQKQSQNLENLEKNLKQAIFQQDDAIERIVSSILRNKAGLGEEDKPIGNFLFYGPTGVGKTELAKQLAKHLGISFLRFDMSEYLEKHTISRLIGAPPGYVGYDEGGLLSDAVRKNPHALILFDEIEKAHTDMHNILLQVMDYGKLTDSNGRKIDFCHTIIVLTSNVGAVEMNRSGIGFGNKGNDSMIENEINRTFSPEFRNRLDGLIRFNSLSKENLDRILIEQINELKILLKKKKQIKLLVEEDFICYLSNKAYKQNLGARPVKSIINKDLKDPITKLILFEKAKKANVISVKMDKIKQEVKFLIN